MAKEKYVFFEDMEDGGLHFVNITDEEFEKLAPHADDMFNCNPLNEELNELLFGDIFDRPKATHIEIGEEDDNVLVQRLC